MKGTISWGSRARIGRGDRSKRTRLEQEEHVAGERTGSDNKRFKRRMLELLRISRNIEMRRLDHEISEDERKAVGRGGRYQSFAGCESASERGAARLSLQDQQETQEEVLLFERGSERAGHAT